MEPTREIVAVLGGGGAIGAQVKDATALERRIREGLPYASYEHVARVLSVDLQTIGDVILLPKSTRARRKNKTLRAAESDRLVRVADAVARAQRVLGSAAKAAAWFQRPNQALGGEIPLRKLDTEVGERQVAEVLGRLEHGVIG